MTDKFLLELENFLNEKFDGEWDMSWQIEERAIDIRLILNQDKEVINFKRVNPVSNKIAPKIIGILRATLVEERINN